MRIGRSRQILGLFITSFKSFSIAERPRFYTLLLSWVLLERFRGEWEQGCPWGICSVSEGLAQG